MVVQSEQATKVEHLTPVLDWGFQGAQPAMAVQIEQAAKVEHLSTVLDWGSRCSNMWWQYGIVCWAWSSNYKGRNA